MTEDCENGDLGIMLHGYDGAQARAIGEFLTALAGRDVAVYGAGDGRRKVLEIIEGRPDEGFEPGEIAVLMFLGFDDGLIEAALGSFPKDGLMRPIFCTLTENNMSWSVSYLIEHLLEEKRAWERRESRK
jgi:hypothetical protein